MENDYLEPPEYCDTCGGRCTYAYDEEAEIDNAVLWLIGGLPFAMLLIYILIN